MIDCLIEGPGGGACRQCISVEARAGGGAGGQEEEEEEVPREYQVQGRVQGIHLVQGRVQEYRVEYSSTG